MSSMRKFLSVLPWIALSVLILLVSSELLSLLGSFLGHWFQLIRDLAPDSA